MSQQITQLQEEIDKETKKRDEMRFLENATSDEKQKVKLMAQMVCSCNFVYDFLTAIYDISKTIHA